MKIPIIQNTGRAPRIGAGMAYDPSSEIAAQGARVKSIESMVNLAEGFQQKYEEAQDQADLIKYRNASTELATKIANKKKSILLDENNTLRAEEIWDAKLQPEVDKFKSELGSLVSYRNKSKYESIFDGTASQLKLGDETDNLDRELTDFATTLGFNLENNLIAGNAEAAQATYNQMRNIVGDALPREIASNATKKYRDTLRTSAVSEYTETGNYEKFITDISNAGIAPSPFFSNTDAVANKSASVKIIQQVNKGLNQLTEGSIELINEGIINDDLDVTGINQGMSVLPEIFQNKVIAYAEKRVSEYASMEGTGIFTRAQDKDNISDFLKMYNEARNGKNINISDMFAQLKDTETLRVQELGILLIGDLIKDHARNGGKLSMSESLLGKIDFKTSLGNQITPINQYAVDFFDNSLQTFNQLEGENAINFIADKAKKWTDWALEYKEGDSPTEESYLEFRNQELKIYNQNIIDNSSLGIGRNPNKGFALGVADKVFK
jgi:hypothetical protein